MRNEQILHEEVRAGERMAAKTFARRAAKGCVGCRSSDGRHVARLACLLVVEVAVLPLEVRHLFGKAADGLSGCVERRRVERMTGSAECGLAKVVRLSDGETRSESVY